MNLIIFLTPLDARCEVAHDTGGWAMTGTPTLDPSGRPGQGYTIPEHTQNGHGFTLNGQAAGYHDLHQRGILRRRDDGTWALEMDDFHLVKKPGGGSETGEVHIVDDHFERGGHRWIVKGLDGFCDHALLTDGNVQQLRDACKQSQDVGANLRRVFGSMVNIRSFDPQALGERFYQTLPELFSIYAEYGLFGEYDVLPDTGYMDKSLGWCQGHWARTCDILKPISNRLVSLTNEYDHGGNLVGTPNDYPRPQIELCSQGSAVSDAPPPRPGWGFREFHVLKQWPKMALIEDMWFNQEGVDVDGHVWGPRKPAYLSECVKFREHDPRTDERMARTLAHASLGYGQGLVFHNEDSYYSRLMRPRIERCAKTAMDVLGR